MTATQPAPLELGYLLPTRDAVTAGNPATAPLLALGERAERHGFDAVWVGDSPLARARHDALLMLAALAARTERITLASGVLLGALRQPVLLAHAVATLDHLAEGRLVLGLGAGFPYPATERQFEALGVPFEGRVGRLLETIEILRRLWRSPDAPVSFAGRFCSFEDVVLAPGPHRRGGPPLWLAGAGPGAEGRVGRLADGWLPYPPTVEQYADGWARVTEAAAEAGRPAPVAGLYLTVSLDNSAARAEKRLRRNIERYYSNPLESVSAIQAMYAGTPEGLSDRLDPYLRAGVRHVVLRVADEQPERGLDSAAAALPSLRALADAATETET